MNDIRKIIVPGFKGSGPEHWQSIWASSMDNTSIMEVGDWDKPCLDEWIDALNNEIKQCPSNYILIAHSLGCILVAHWISSNIDERMRGVMMVAPADVDLPEYTPDAVRGFSPLPRNPLNTNCVVVTSSNDPNLSVKRASAFAASWGGQEIKIGYKGHINAASGIGEWEEGKQILSSLIIRATNNDGTA